MQWFTQCKKMAKVFGRESIKEFATTKSTNFHFRQYTPAKALEQENQDARVSYKKKSATKSFVNEPFERIATKTSRFAHFIRLSSITSSKIHRGVKREIP